MARSQKRQRKRQRQRHAQQQQRVSGQAGIDTARRRPNPDDGSVGKPRTPVASTLQTRPTPAGVRDTSRRDPGPATPRNSAANAAGNPPEARFISGSILGHILVMTGTGALGLMSVFSSDLVNLLFLGQLHDTEVLAAVGYASTLLFFSTSIGIGLAIGATAVVAPAIGAGQKDDARRLTSVALLLTAAVGLALSLIAWPFLGTIVGLLGANGRTQSLAAHYLAINYPSLPLLALGMTSAGVLRSAGDPRRAMFVTLSGAIVNVVLDAVLILALHLGLEGAACASVIARVTMATVGLLGVGSVHGLLRWPHLDAKLRATSNLPPAFWTDVARLLSVAIPAVATNLATPVANAFVTRALAGYGDTAIATWSVYGRVNPVAFGAIFALTGSIAPIVGQNFGAGNFARVRNTIYEAARATVAFTAIAWAVLALSPSLIVWQFGLGADSIALVDLTCYVLPPMFAFLGFLFIANAVFNTLRYPHYATLFNWGRATLGTIPFVMLGGHLAGAAGVFVGSLLSGVVFGSAALWTCLRLIDTLAAERKHDGHASS